MISIKGSLMMPLVRVSLWLYWQHIGEMEKRSQGMAYILLKTFAISTPVL
jgi:hypothetical protein